MGFDIQPSDNRDKYCGYDYPAIDSDGYIEDWWKRAVDDYESLLYDN